MRRANPLVPRDLETICLCALEKDPARRYASPAALASDLRRFLEFKPVEARPAGPLLQLARWCRRHAVAASVVGLVVLLAMASLVALWQLNVNRVIEAEKQRAQRASALSHFRYAELLAQRGDWQEALASYAAASFSGASVPSSCRQRGQTGASASKVSGRKPGYPPIITVGQHGGMIVPVGDGIGATQLARMVMSPARAAGIF